MFDQPPSIGEIVIAGRQRPHAVQVIRQDYPGVDMEWPFDSNRPYHRSKQVDVPNEQIVWITFEQIDGEEIGSAGYATTAIIGHRDSSSEKPITQATIADRGNIGFTMAFPIIASCGAIRGTAIAPYSPAFETQRRTDRTPRHT